MYDCVRNRVDEWLARSARPQAVNEYGPLTACVGTALGNVRGENQDRAVIVRFTSKRPTRSFLLFSVCDGLGGMQDGARCARLALAEIVSALVSSDRFGPTRRLLRAVSEANDLLATEYSGRGGTTLSAILASPSGRASGVNVGDSRIYTYMPSRTCEQVSVDDTIAGQIQRLRGLKSIQVDRDHFSEHLTQYIGIGKELQPHSFEIDVSSHEAHYLLTSDGAHRPLSSGLAGLAIHAPSCAELVRRILHFSKWSGGHDNASALAFGPVAPEAIPLPRPPSSDIIELWDPYGKLDLVGPFRAVPRRYSKRVPPSRAEASPPAVPPETKESLPEKTDVPHRQPNKMSTPSREDASDQPKVDIAGFEDRDLVEGDDT